MLQDVVANPDPAVVRPGPLCVTSAQHVDADLVLVGDLVDAALPQSSLDDGSKVRPATFARVDSEVDPFVY